MITLVLGYLWNSKSNRAWHLDLAMGTATLTPCTALFSTVRTMREKVATDMPNLSAMSSDSKPIAVSLVLQEIHPQAAVP